MTELTHITQCDDPKYLPFARARIKAMRATGLQFLSQKFEVEGMQINVWVEGEHSFISVAGSKGGYQCLPHSIVHPDGRKTDETGHAIEPNSVVTQKKGGAPPVYKVRVQERKKVVTGLNDWRSNDAKNPRVITFSAARQRYFGFMPLRLPGIFEKNKKTNTKVTLPGKGEVNCGVLGAGVFRTEGKSFLMMATTGAQGDSIMEGSTLYICYRTGGKWKIAGTNDLPANWDFTSLVIFSPGGTKFSAVVRDLDTMEIIAERVSGTLSLLDPETEELTVVAEISRTVIGGTARVTTPLTVVPPQVSFVEIPYSYTITQVYTGGTYVRTFTGFSWGLTVTYSGNTSGTGDTKTYMYPLAYDYDQDDNEVLVSITSQSVSEVRYASSGYSNQLYTGVGPEPPYAESETVTITGAAVGWFVSATQSGIDRLQAREAFIADNVTNSIEEITSYTSSIRFVNTSVYDITWYINRAIAVYDDMSGSWVHTQLPVEQRRAWLLALDARTNTCVTSTIESSVNPPYDNNSLWDWSAELKITCLGQAKTEKWHLPQRQQFLSEVGPDYRIHFRLFNDEVSGNYASLDGESFMVSASVDPLLESLFLPVTDSAVIMITDGSDPRDKFTIGVEPGFAIDPITIF